MLESDVDRFKVIDTDTHIIEPYDLWTSRLDVGKWGDKVPHVRFDEVGDGVVLPQWEPAD